MTDIEKREAARQFCQRWSAPGKGKEDEDARSYWIEFLQNVIGMENATERIDFEKKVIGPDGNTKRIDVYIPETRVLIEQKSIGIALDKPQQGHNGMTPYEQAKMYDNSLPYEEKSRWIIVSNFAEIWVYNLNDRKPEPQKFVLSDIQNKYSLFDFLVNVEQKKISEEMRVSIEAGKFVGLLYDALLKEYIDPENPESLKSLNMLCVRLVFCLYAEDAHIFGSSGRMFYDYMNQFETKDMRKALIELFRTLDTPEEKRDKYDKSDLSKFPYVNGGLFADENIEIPNFTEEIRDVLLEKASDGFDWSDISPTIFGAVFESTLNPETRRSGGMHYTSIENIHKVIDPLFLDDLKAGFEEIQSIQVERSKKPKLEAFQNKLASLKWLDPACGSGNFLTETFISIRRLENRVIRAILDCDRTQVDGQIVLGMAINPIKVGINAFYGIEINDFAVTVAKTALWIAESQMIKETEDIVHMTIDFLPLKTQANIIEGNALRLDWNEVCPKNELNYIMGNPPFVARAGRLSIKESSSKAMMDAGQKSDRFSVFGEDLGNVDYVACWFKKASVYSKESNIKTAFVATDSICQGQQVYPIWHNLLKDNIYINFAYKYFKWDSEASQKATVFVVIVGFSHINYNRAFLYDNIEKKVVTHISPYLMESDDILVTTRNTPLCDVPVVKMGNQPIDNGNYLFTFEQMQDFIKKEPESKVYFKKWLDGAGFINDTEKFCLWLGDCTPSQLRKMPECLKRVENVKEFREKSKRSSTIKLANKPTRFQTENMPTGNYIVIPEVSSGNRRYIPMGFLDHTTLCSNTLRLMRDATLYHFGILQSNVHMAWMRTVCGYFGPSYRYSINIVYNNFPWPSPTPNQKAKIEETAQGILDARAIYPDSSLADLYDPLTMPPELQKAHTANDKAVMQAYGFDIKNTSESDCVAALMKMYQELTAKES